MRTLRILVVTNMYPTPEKPIFGVFVARQMAGVEKLGHTVQVEFIRGDRSMGPYARGMRRVRSLTRKGAFDIVHAHYGLSGFVAAFQSIPLVVSFCGSDLLGVPNERGGITSKSRLEIKLSHIAARRADGIICKSEGMRESLPDRRDRDRARVIGNGVDTDSFRPGDRALARDRLGLSPTDRLILFPQDPVKSAIKRFDLARSAVQRLGNGHEAKLWEVHGVTPELMPDYYHAADCLLLTSDHEGSPNVVKEALCCDLPVVSVDVGDVKHWLAMVPGCELVASDPGAIAQGIEQVLGATGRVDGSRVRAALSSDIVAKEVVQLYEAVLDARASRDSRNRQRGHDA